jgi:hypothetical protein
MDFVELGSGNPQPNSYTVPLNVTLTEFVDRFNLNLKHYLGSRWIMSLPESYVESDNRFNVVFDNATLWDALIKIHEVFGVRWSIKSGDVMDIQVAYDPVEVEHIFEYGKDNGLVSVERNNALERIVTRLRGRGSERNLPADYFHEGDPDTNNTLQNIYYANLMPKVYRDYVRGYNAGSGSDTWAYNLGVADKTAGKPMSPVDYILSDNEALWGISYGAINPNSEIYPTLQGATRNGVRLDEIVKVEDVLQDKIVEPLRESAVDVSGAWSQQTARVGKIDEIYYYLPDCLEQQETILVSKTFFVERNINTIKVKLLTLNATYVDSNGVNHDIDIAHTSSLLTETKIEVVQNGVVITSSEVAYNDVEHSYTISNLPVGQQYAFRAVCKWKANDNHLLGSVISLRFEMAFASIAEYAKESDRTPFKSTFDIWIKDVWNSTRQSGESDADYTYRIWSPLAVKEEMAVMFSDGYLAGEDYEYRVVGFSADSDNLYQVITSAIKPVANVAGASWKLTLEKSDAELQASGMYLPNTQQQAKVGDHFFFINIAMPYDPYVYDAEARLDAYLSSELALLDEEFPSFTISPSKIFCKDFSENNKIKSGSKIRLRNVELVGDSYITLHIQSLTKRYTANSLNPEWNITLSDKVVASGNPISLIEGEVKVIASQVYSNQEAVREAIRQLQATFLRKDGLSDTSYSETTFRKAVRLRDNLIDDNFRQGDLSGRGFGVYTDSDGNRVIEADILVGRIGARFNEVVINQTTYSGGKQIFSAAGMVVTDVQEVDGVYRCFFDTKNGTSNNLFKVGDGAFSQRFTSSGIRYYWRRVVSIGSDYVDISISDCLEGSEIPLVGDNIAQLGSVSEKSRQAAIIIDVMRDEGGLVTWYDDITGYSLSNKDSVNIGRIDGKTWLQVFGAGYIGARDESEYVKYEDGKVDIKARVHILPGSTGFDNIEEIKVLDYLKLALQQSTSVSGGLVLTSLIQLGYTDPDTGEFFVQSGINGINNNDTDIAAWYGGSMVDREVNPNDITAAKALFRFDGSGYFANGNISWNTAGYGQIAGGKIKWDSTGFWLSPDFKISVKGDETLNSLLNKLQLVEDWFTLSNGVLKSKYTIASEKDVVAYSGNGESVPTIPIIPIASANSVGGVKINGNGLEIDEDGLLRVVGGSGGASSWDEISGKPTFATVATSGSYNDLSNKPALFSGNYNDLSNKPTIPTNTNQLTNGAGYITGITNGNEFTFVPSGFSGDIWINFRTAGGFNGNITEYKFGNGNGGILGTAIHTGNIGSQSVNYATSAGALASRTTDVRDCLIYRCRHGISETLVAAPDWCKPAGVGSDGNSMILRMSWSSGAFGHDIFASPNASDLWHRATQNNTEAWKKIIDSGNIGSQSVNYATSAGNADTLDGYHYNGLPYLSTSGGTVSGNITANHFYKASDDRLKIRLQDYNVSLSVISQIPSFLFKWKDSKRGQDVMLGTSAQSLENLGLNQLVHTNTEGEKSVSYDMLGLLAISALKEVYNELNVLKQRLNLLEGR